ncbi:hypothetical protein V8G54_027692, partial [Vigna mungo]
TVQKCSNLFSSETHSDSVVTVAAAAAAADAAAAVDCDDHDDDHGDHQPLQRVLMSLLLPPFPWWTWLLLINHLVFVFVKCEREILVGKKRRQIERHKHTDTE